MWPIYSLDSIVPHQLPGNGAQPCNQTNLSSLGGVGLGFLICENGDDVISPLVPWLF